MNRLPKNVLELPFEQRALLALKAAVKEAIAERVREGLPVYVWRDGKVVALSAKDLRARSPRRASARRRTNK
ncbi:MAG: hypothetical protein ACREUU_12450 [Gammaproteobacteria bacterium]